MIKFLTKRKSVFFVAFLFFGNIMMVDFNFLIMGYFDQPNEKHKVFLSYYHNDDQWYKDRIEDLFGHLFINKSVQDGDIDTDVSTEYIKQLIQSDDYLANASVLIVLCGPNTLGRKHVDWEISGALNKKVGGYSGIIGILLPEFPLTPDGKYDYSDIPARLADNVKTGFAEIYTWRYITDASKFTDVIERAFKRRTAIELIDNNRPQMQRNTSGL
ncbi:MAG: TIR domain-containing protein [Patescibacteria group bacterium]